MVTLTQLKRFAPDAKQDILRAIVDNWDAARAAGIDTPLRIQHFLAQIAHESAGFTALSENFNYKSGSRLYDVFDNPPRNGLTRQKAVSLVKQGPEAIANFVYGLAWGKKNLGNTKPGDGWLFRGGGLMQTTGRYNYTKRATALGMTAEELAEAVRDPATAFIVACKEWEVRKCNTAADRDDVVDVTKKINGGTTGLKDRRVWLADAKNIFLRAAAEEVSAGLADNMTEDEIKSIQMMLDQKGYHEVGEIDGRWGRKTRGAMSTFQLDNGLANTDGKLDEATLAALPIAPNREIAAERKNANVKTVMDNAPGVIAPSVATKQQGLWATIALTFSTIATIVMNNLRVAYEYIEDFRDVVPLSVWFGLFAAVIFYFGWLRPRQQEKSSVKSYQTGKAL